MPVAAWAAASNGSLSESYGTEKRPGCFKRGCDYWFYSRNRWKFEGLAAVSFISARNVSLGLVSSRDPGTWLVYSRDDKTSTRYVTFSFQWERGRPTEWMISECGRMSIRVSSKRFGDLQIWLIICHQAVSPCSCCSNALDRILDFIFVSSKWQLRGEKQLMKCECLIASVSFAHQRFCTNDWIGYSQSIIVLNHLCCCSF